MTAATEAPARSKVEEIKEASEGLEGGIPAGLASAAAFFDEPEVALLKHHGTYQQDNRDERAALKREGKDKAWIFMVRSKIPGGRMTADQWLAHDEIASKWTYGSLRITSRQGIQMHGVGKHNMKNVIRGINDSRLTTLGACGDVNRNVMACPVCDLDSRSNLGLDALCAEIAEHFAPRSSAYYEIWCDGEKLGQKVPRNREEPIYGKTYLPRKFKMGVAVPEDNCVDLYSQDLGAEAVRKGTKTVAWDILIGGGMGFSFSKKETYPRLASRLVRAKPEEALAVIEEVVKIQRDFGGRAERHQARLKYLLDERGLDWFKEELFRRLGRELPDAGPAPVYEVHDHIGWTQQSGGKLLMLGVPVQSGRVEDTADAKAKTGLREAISRFRPGIRLTPHQNLVLTGIKPKDQGALESLLKDHGIKLAEAVSPLRRRALACPALPTCGLALADSERAIPGILDELEAMGHGGATIELRMTGCPNSCVRTPNAEIGIVGRGPGKYALFAGGSPQGHRLAFQLRETVNREAVAPLLGRLMTEWTRETGRDEAFGDWSHRRGIEGLDQILAGAN